MATSAPETTSPGRVCEILVVDDDAQVCASIQALLQDEGYTARTCLDGDAAFAELSYRVVSLVLLDIWLEAGEREGLKVLERVQESFPNVSVVMISGHGSVQTAVEAMNLGASDFIEKPFEGDHLLHVVARVLETERLRRENAELARKVGHPGEMLGSSLEMKSLRTVISKVAPTNSRILVTGQHGTGKETIARVVHAASKWSDGVFVVVGAPTMLPDRFEEELFGREDGNGNVIRVGFFEQAHGGTLFIDEVSEMPLETQGRMIRALQEPTFVRVGGTTPVAVDARIITASSSDIEAQVEAGNFRADLYYRLNVVPLQAPALSERREDIPQLAEHFMLQCARALGRQPRPFTQEALARLQTCAWPGNVRQLRNVIERVLILAPGTADEPVEISMLPDEVLRENAAPQSFTTEAIMSSTLRKARAAFESEYLSSQLVRFGGSVVRTAEFVGMERTALSRKLKSLGISASGTKEEEEKDES